MSRTVTTTGSIAPFISSYDSDHQYYQLSNASRSYTEDINSTTYSSCNMTRGSGAVTYMYWKFDTSALPSDVDIDSVSCVCRSKVSNQNASNVATKYIQMSSGTTLKGTATNLTTTVTNRTMSVGDWTRAELNDVRIYAYAQRGTSNTNTSYYIQIYAAQLTINYSKTITYYSVNASSSISGSTVVVSDAEKEAGGTVTVTFTISGGNFAVTDNDVDVTSQLSGSGTTYTYTISNISADHDILLYDPTAPVGQEIFYKQNGSWVAVDTIFVKQNGAWNQVVTMYVKENGVWKGGSEVPSRLPSGYTEVQYIENETTARINTGISGISEWTITAQLITDPGTSGVLLARGTAGGHYFGSVPGASNNWGTGASSGQYVSISAFTKESISINFSSSTVISGTIDGNTFSRTASSGSSSNIYLFNATSSSSYPFKGRIYGDVVCVQNNAEVFRGVPCTDPNGIAGLYDLIGESFKGSTNSETFTAGPAI